MGSPVILAATSLANQNGAFSPQHQNNWQIEIQGLIVPVGGSILNGSDPVSFSLARGFLPAVGVDDVTIPFGNEEVHYAGRAHFEQGTLEIRDYVDVDIQGALVQWMSLIYGGVIGNWGVIGQPKAYKRPADVIMSAPDGTLVRSWRLQGLWPVSLNPGNLDMSSSEQVMIAMSMRYDRAQYMSDNTSFGSAAVQAVGTYRSNLGGQ